MSREVVVVSGVRTAIGTFGGSLKDIPPTALGAQVVRESLKRAQVDGADVGHVVFGHVVNTEPRDMYLSRVAAIEGGCAEGTPAFNVNRLCGSGLQAIVSASQAILLGDADIAIGGGAENMSRAPFASLNTRWGARMIARGIAYCARLTSEGGRRSGEAVEATLKRAPLTPRERDVLDGIAAGLSYREIAAREGVSIHTVQTHIKGLYGKLAVHSKVEAVFEAERCGWLPR